MANYKKLDDHTLMETKKVEDRRSLRRIFDFEARQVSVVFEATSYDGGRGIGMSTQNFADIEGGEEYIDGMRKKLIELGGLPELAAEPTLDDYESAPSLGQ